MLRGLPIHLLALFLAASQGPGWLAAATDAGSFAKAPAAVLILNSYHAGYRWTEDQVDGLRATVTAGGTPAEFYVEYLDSKRFQAGYRSFGRLATWLKSKYEGMTFAAVVATDDNAFDFLLDYHADLFPNVPAVFCGVNRDTKPLIAGRPLFTGVEERKDTVGALELALRLHPRTRNVVLLGDNSKTSRINRQSVEQALSTQPHLNVVNIDGSATTFEEITEVLKRVDADSICFFLGFWKDRTGRTFPPDVCLSRFTAAAAIPFYAHADIYIGSGAVGGLVCTARQQGELAGGIVVDLLAGKRPTGRPVIVDAPNVPMFDYLALRRFGLGTDRLPANAIILNPPPPPLHHRYRLELIVLGTTSLLLLALASFLLVEVARLRKMEQARRLSENDLEVILGVVDQAVVAVDADGIIARMNAAAASLTGLPPANAIGKPLAEVVKLIERDSRRPVSFDLPASHAADNQPPTPRLLVGQDGNERPVAVAQSPLRQPNGKIAGLVLVVRDLTDELRVQEELRQAQKMEAIGKLAGGVAHDFNNYLTSIIGNAELLRLANPDNPELAEGAEQIIKASSRAADLTGQLLTFSRKGRLHMKPIDVHTLLDEVIKLLNHSLDRRISVEVERHAYRHWVRGDATQLQNAFLNLSINARDAMPDGGALSFQTSDVAIDDDHPRVKNAQLTPGKYLQIAVSDTGGGVEQKLRERIFEPFFTTKEAGKGTGLGLASVYGAVRNHHGLIEMQSRPGHGTTFTILLPVCRAPETEGINAAPNATSHSGKGRILVVDDEEAIRVLLAKMLKQLGYQADMCCDGLEAVDFYSRHNGEIDLVVLDLMMPRMDGEAAFGRIRTINPAAKVLIVSGFTKNKVVDNLLQNGAVGFLPKPFHLRTIAEEIARHLG